MLRRTIYIGFPAYIRVEHNCLLVNRKTHDPPLLVDKEDIGLIILDHPQLTITHRAVELILSSKGAIIWCNSKHLPESILISEALHHLRSKRIRMQIEASIPLKKQIWKQIIQKKLQNQALVLKFLNKPYIRIKNLIKKVTSGDSTNVEATAASYYWRNYGKDLVPRFKRIPEGITFPNNLLNYGYAILRALVARAFAAAGFLLSLGIHHRSQYNCYALADDMMEPFRPWVDYWVYQYAIQVVEEADDLDAFRLSPPVKHYLLHVCYLTVKWGQKHFSLMEAAEKMALEFLYCLEKKKRKMTLPELPELSQLTMILDHLR